MKTKRLTFILFVLPAFVKLDEEVSSCIVYGTTTFCVNTTDLSDPNERIYAKILRTSGTLAENDFPIMSNLVGIEFSSNNLTHIEPRLFMKFPNLNRLIIRGNEKFPNITRELLKHCKKLTNLKIYFNTGLNHIEENVLRNFPQLQKLVIRSERIQHLRKHDLEVVKELKVLKLDLTTLKTIDVNAFEPIGDLEKLSLMANNFLKINPEIFKWVPKLKELNLIYGEITDLWFLKLLPKLQILQLAGNRINSISAETFEGMKNLRQLDLAHTGITHIDTSKLFFDNLPNLEKIDLTCHKLSKELYVFAEFDKNSISVFDKSASISMENKYLMC